MNTYKIEALVHSSDRDIQNEFSCKMEAGSMPEAIKEFLHAINRDEELIVITHIEAN